MSLNEATRQQNCTVFVALIREKSSLLTPELFIDWHMAWSEKLSDPCMAVCVHFFLHL